MFDGISNWIENYFLEIFNTVSVMFSKYFADMMANAVDILDKPFVKDVISYSQALALSLLAIKGISDIIKTYILHTNGDPDADPKGVLIGISQAVAVILSAPWIVKYVFVFGSKIANDIAGLTGAIEGTGEYMLFLGDLVLGGFVYCILGLILLIGLLIVAIQAAIRGAELALLSVIAPIIALNLSSNNTNMFSSWFKNLVVLTVTHAIQIFLIKGIIIFTAGYTTNNSNFLLIFGFLWVTIKTPSFIKQYAHSTGFTGAIGGSVKSAGSMYLRRRIYK